MQIVDVWINYKYIEIKYDNWAKFLLKDTESLAYEIKTAYVYKDLYENKKLFDFSDCQKDSKFFDFVNK